MAKTIKYHDLLIQQLKKPEVAISYLNAAFEESRKGDTKSQQNLQNALEDIAEARGWNRKVE